MKGGTLPFYALRSEFIARLQQTATRLHNIERAKSRRQYALAREVIAEWEAHSEYAAEMTKDEFYCEASRVLCDTVGFSIVTTTGETLRRWVEVFQGMSDVPDALKDKLPFEYFEQARYLVNNGYVAFPMMCLSTALEHKLNAGEMRRWYTGDKIADALVLEFRNQWPKPFWGMYGILESANGRRDEILFHMREIQRLHETGG